MVNNFLCMAILFMFMLRKVIRDAICFKIVHLDQYCQVYQPLGVRESIGNRHLFYIGNIFIYMNPDLNNFCCMAFLFMFRLSKVIKDVICFKYVHHDQHYQVYRSLGVRESIRNGQNRHILQHPLSIPQKMLSR